MKIFASVLCASIAALCSGVRGDQVLLLAAEKDMLHETPNAKYDGEFSPSGLAELAMDAMGLATSTLRNNEMDGFTKTSPVQADLFQKTNSYAMILIDSFASSSPLLTAIDAQLQSTAAYHQIFSVADGVNEDIPAVVTQEFQTAFGDEALVVCAGSTTFCSKVNAKSNGEIQQDSINAELKLVRQLEDLQKLTTMLSEGKQPSQKSFYVVGLMDADNADAQAAIVAQVSDFLEVLQQVHGTVGAQVVTSTSVGTSASSPEFMLTLDEPAAYGRLLLSFLDLAGEGSNNNESDDDDSTANNSTSSVSMEDIAEYQIVLWTSVLLALVVLLAIIAMCSMNTGRDSLLYAKFIADANHRKGD